MSTRIRPRLVAVLSSTAALFFTIAAAEIEPGVLVHEVSCSEAPGKSYALYLPSGYTGDRTWPLILAFDPGGLGRRPVEMLREAAEEFGYVVAGSNDSRNFNPWADNLGAAAAMWRDVTGRFSIDGARVYTTGFSGGARVATEVALQMGTVAGVFVNGGGFREKDAIDGEFSFLLVGASGSGDMNHREVETMHRRLLKRGLPSRHLYFEGGHQWAPPEVARRAVAWFEVRAHRLESGGAEPAAVAVLFEEAAGAARRIEDAGEPYRALLEYEQLARDFDGLVDLTAVHRAAERLAAKPRTRYAKKEASRWRKIEDAEREKLAKAMRRIESAVGDPTARTSALHGLRYSLAEVQRSEESGERARVDVARRLRSFVSTVGLEWSIRATQQGQQAGAATYLEIAILADRDNPYLHVRSAAAHARRGQERAALESLHTAVDLGFNDADRLRSSDAFDEMRENAAFREIVESLDRASEP